MSTTREQPWPLRTMLAHFQGYVGRLGQVWVTGEISKRRVTNGQTYFTLRDEHGSVSADVMIHPSRFAGLARTPVEGDRVILLVKMHVTKQTRILLRAAEIHLAGYGDLLAEIERRRRLLAAEGLFAVHLKKQRPLIPRRVGVVTGRDSDALKDVVRITRGRFPGVRLEIRETAVQGEGAVAGILAAMRQLDAHPEVDVIIVTRGGGSLEDLLAFSDEGLVRAVAAMTTPIISAIGHEADRPILDDVADERAATPTHAATLAVPDVEQVVAHVDGLRRALRNRIDARVSGERRLLAQWRSRQVLREPRVLLTPARERLHRSTSRLRPSIVRRVENGRIELGGLDLQLRALSPQATLDRGYALVTDEAGQLVREVPAAGSVVHVRVQSGVFDAQTREGGNGE